MINAAEIKRQVDIKNLLLHLGAKESGHTNLSCPFHASKSNQSLSYDVNKGVFRCASSNCKANDGGDCFSAVALAENLDVKTEFPDVVRRTCEIMGIKPSFTDVQEKDTYEIRLRRANIIKKCHDHFFSVCRNNWGTKKGKKVLKYIKNRRGYSEEFIKENLGFFDGDTAKETIDELFKLSEGISEQINSEKKYFANTFHAFKDRIIHPHFFRNNILHFTAEQVKEDSLK